MPHSWERALQEYCYPVDLAKFIDRNDHPDWFRSHDSPLTGDQAATIAFENRFRRLAPDRLEAWYEVVFWKMYSQKRRRDYRTKEVTNRIKCSRTTASQLVELCRSYMNKPDKKSFRKFQKSFFTSYAVPVAATFPSFLDPDNFPMVDREVAQWARCNGPRYSYAQFRGPVLSCAPDVGYNRPDGTTITTRHWSFVKSWYDWCRYTATILTERSNRKWRARDVEMAVFTAQTSKGRINLNPLQP